MSAVALRSSRMMMGESTEVIDEAEESFSDVQARMELFGDVETGSPTPPRKEDNAWRSRRLHTYVAEGHYDGDGAAHASHLFHKDYRHYKFYGTYRIVHHQLMLVESHSPVHLLLSSPGMPMPFILLIYLILSSFCAFILGQYLTFRIATFPPLKNPYSLIGNFLSCMSTHDDVA